MNNAVRLQYLQTTNSRCAKSPVALVFRSPLCGTASTTIPLAPKATLANKCCRRKRRVLWWTF